MNKNDPESTYCFRVFPKTNHSYFPIKYVPSQESHPIIDDKRASQTQKYEKQSGHAYFMNDLRFCNSERFNIFIMNILTIISSSRNQI